MNTTMCSTEFASTTSMSLVNFAKCELLQSLLRLGPPEKHAEFAEVIKNIELLVDAIIKEKTRA